MGTRSLLALALGSAFVSGCTITSVGSEDSPPRVESKGLIEGHAAVGLRDEDRFLRLRVLDGESDGALGEFVLWKLFRLEVGALGVAVGVGPIDLALGTLFYDPDVPRMTSEASAKKGEDGSERVVAPEADCDICRAAAEAAKSD